MTAQFKPLTIPPGVVATATKKMASTNYAETNMVRWVEGQLAPVGGQSAYPYVFASRCKRVHGWFGLDQIYRIAYLCEAHLYVDEGGVLTDISPGTDPTNVLYGDGNYSEGLYSGATTQPIQPPVIGAGGYSDGFYGASTYGTPRAESTSIQLDKIPDAFSLDNFGAILLAMTSPDGRLLMWDPAVGGVATEITPSSGSTVPTGRCFVVTPERFVQVFGAVDAVNGGGPRRFAWCEQEDFTNWSYSDLTTQAGFIDIEPASPIITAISTRNGTLFWTAKKTYRSRYLGAPYIYNYDELGDATTPWSPQSAVTTSSMVLWFSQQGPYSYDGTSVLPVQCMVRAWIDDDIDILNVREQACAVHVANFNEFWWFFPQNGQVGNTRAVVYNYKEGWWAQARMARSAGITASYTAHTVMANGTVAYEHENGLVYNDSELPWIETFDLYLDSGFHLTTVKQLMPDIEGAVSNVLYSLFYRNSRSLGVGELQTPPRVVRSNGYVDFRTTGRDLRLRIDLAAPAGFVLDPVNKIYADGLVRPVTVGQHLIDSVPRGDR